MLYAMAEPMVITTKAGDTLTVRGFASPTKLTESSVRLEVSLLNARVAAELRDATIEIRGDEYRVVGNPFPSRVGGRAGVRIMAWRALFDSRCTLRDSRNGDIATPCRMLGGVHDELDSMGRWRRTVSIHVAPGVWHDGITAFEFDGKEFRIVATNRVAESEEGVLLTGEQEPL